MKVSPGDFEFSDLALTACKLCRENKYDTNGEKHLFCESFQKKPKGVRNSGFME